MKTMRKLFLVAAMIAVAISAEAQYGRRGDDSWWREGNYEHQRDRRYDDHRGYGKRYDNPIDEMQRDLRREIEVGIRRGSITRYESKRLYRELDQIERREDRYFDDGFLSKREFNDLARDLTQLNREVRQQKRDDDRNAPRSRYDDRYGRNRY